MIGDRGAQVLMLPEHCETVCSALKQIRSVPVDVDRIDLKDLKVKAQTIKEVTTISNALLTMCLSYDPPYNCGCLHVAFVYLFFKPDLSGVMYHMVVHIRGGVSPTRRSGLGGLRSEPHQDGQPGGGRGRHGGLERDEEPCSQHAGMW